MTDYDKKIRAITHIKTHRCEELLNMNKNPRKTTIAIRYGRRYGSYYDKEEGNKWWLDSLRWDSEWDTTFMSPTCSISYCPLCGEKL